MTIGRNRRDFHELNKEDIKVEGYDTIGRQEAKEKEEKKVSFRDIRGTLTEEQVHLEAGRCLSCGASVVDENKCIGCGICTTKCEFDAIKLHRDHPECSKMCRSEDKFKEIGAYAAGTAFKTAFANKPEVKKAAKKTLKKAAHTAGTAGRNVAKAGRKAAKAGRKAIKSARKGR